MTPGAPGWTAAHCEKLVREGDSDRYFATLFAPADRRPHLFALYAFALEVARVRDTVYALAVGFASDHVEALWARLSRVLPTPWRAEALVLLAFSAYVRGDGPLAGISLDAALDVA